jgi:hypothetical protein
MTEYPTDHPNSILGNRVFIGFVNLGAITFHGCRNEINRLFLPFLKNLNHVMHA